MIALAAAMLITHGLVKRPTASRFSAVSLPSASGSPSAAPRVDVAAAARSDVAAYLAQYRSYASFALLDRVTGQKVLYRENDAFETASIIKVNILATLLWREQRSGTGPSALQQRLATEMITESDNDAASDLWDQIGGARGLAEADTAFGLTGTVPGQGGYWGLTTTTATDQLRLLQLIADPAGPLNSSSRACLLGLMSQVEDDQRWGVPDAAGARATAVYVKNGWLARTTDDGEWIVNSIGRIVEPGHDWLIVVLSDHNATESSGISLVQHAADLAVQNLRAATP